MGLYNSSELNYMNNDHDLVFNEAFIGKTKLMKKVENIIEALRNKYVNSTNGYKELTNIAGKINNDPLVRKLEKCFEDEFNITNVYIFIPVTPDFCNAFTFPIHYDISKYEEIQNTLKNKKGVKFDKRMDLGFIVCITSSLLLMPHMTSGEMTAILLHEIGHNFEMPLLDNVYIPSVLKIYGGLFLHIMHQSENDLFLAVMTMFMYLSQVTVQPDLVRSLKTIKSDSKLATVRDVLFILYDVLSLIRHAKDDVVSFVLRRVIGFDPKFFDDIKFKIKSEVIDRIKAYITTDQVRFLELIFGQVSEKISDRFAAYYGYGPELASALMKFNTARSQNYSKYMGGVDIQAISQAIPVFGHYIGLCNFINSEILNNLSDVHPSNSDRVRDMIQALKDDLKDKSLSPRIRKELTKSIQETEMTYNLYKDITLDASKKRSPKGYVNFSHQMQSILYNIKDFLIPSKLIDLTGTLMRISGINDIIKDNIDKSMPKYKKLLKEHQNMEYIGLYPLVEQNTYESKLFKK